MRPFKLAGANERLSVLCIGAHSDDIEIGAGATILGWIDRGVRLDVHWVVLSAQGSRGDEARAFQYGRDTQRDIAGFVERIGPNRWRLIMPRPHFESQMDVMELVPAS